MSMRMTKNTIVPAGLLVETVEIGTGGVLAVARSGLVSGFCPQCGVSSQSVHSRYDRTLSDLPAHGRRVALHVHVRRFRCKNINCFRKTFSERLGLSIARSYARRTERMAGIIHHIGIALGGRPGQRIAHRLLLPVSNDTLLRTVRNRVETVEAVPKIVGIDDWAWRKGHRYGTLICDLERRRIIDLLPDRNVETVAEWLRARPSIEYVARDGGGSYGAAVTRGRPEACQVADRWHLMENVSAAFLTIVRRNMEEISKTLGQHPIDPVLLSAAERKQYDGWCQRVGADKVVLSLHEQGLAIKEIVRRTGRSRNLVRGIVRGGNNEPFRPRASTLDPYLDWLSQEWDNGCRNGAELWRRLKTKGFQGALRVVSEWATRRRRDEDPTTPRRTPSARSLAKLLTTALDLLPRGDLAVVAAIEKAIPELATAKDLVDRFHSLLRKQDASEFTSWIEEASDGPLAGFVKGIADDKAAVIAAVTEMWSNGQTEGQVNKLKLVKRQMYGRANIDLLRARLIFVPV